MAVKDKEIMCSANSRPMCDKLAHEVCHVQHAILYSTLSYISKCSTLRHSHPCTTLYCILCCFGLGAHINKIL